MPKILIVDDEWLTRLEIEEMLTDHGYEVAGQAETGEEAVKMTRELNPDLILMDVDMPGAMNGIDAARKIKEEVGTPIVFISGHGDPEYIEAAKEIEPFGYVMKPFDEKEVHAFVEIALSKRALELKLKKAHEGLEHANFILQEEIAARKKTERALRESEKLYRDIFEKNNAIKWLVDPSSGKIIDANPAACEFYQYSHEEITNLRIWDINVKGETEMKKVLASANSGEKTEFVFQHRLASGEIRDVQVYTGTLESGGKKLFHSIIIDITDRMRAEKALKRANDELEQRVEIRTAELAETNKQLRRENEAHKRTVAALRESEKKLNVILDATTETIVLFDREGIVHVANKTCCDRLGTTKEEITGKKLYDFFSPEVAEGRRQKWNEVFETGKPVFFEDSRAGMMFEQVAYPILGEGDRIGMVAAFANDKTDRMQAEQALRENEKHFHSFMEDAKGFALYRLKLDPENYYGANVVFASPSLKEIAGISPQEEYSQWFKSVHEDDLPSIIKAQNESSQFGVPLDQEFRVKGIEGEWRWLHAIANPVFDSEGKPEYYNAIMIDVTAQKQAEQALRESEERYRNLVEESFDGIFVQKGQRIIFANKRLNEMLGYEDGELIGRKHWVVYHSDSQKLTRERAQIRLLGEAVERRYEVKLQRKDGSWFFGEINARLITLPSSQERGIQVWIKDIDKRKRDEKKLKDSKRFLQTLIDAIPAPVFYKDREGKYLGFNRAFETFFGAPDEQMVGKTVFGINPPELAEIYYAKDQELLKSGGVQRYESQWQDVHGNLRDFVFNKAAFYDSKRTVIGLIGVLIDITERKQGEEKRRKLETQLQQAQKMESIGTLAGGIAHDFNNILSVIIGYAELALDDVDKDSLLENRLQEIYSAGNRAKELVKQILAFARQSEEKVKPIQVDTIVKEVLKFVRSSIPTTIEIEQNIVSKSLIMGNSTQVHQILMNLCTNAAHAMENDGGILKVSLTDVAVDSATNRKDLNLKSGDYLKIEISDTGTGIAPDIVGSIFEPYFTTKAPGEGTGMGLAMVHGIVETYGGKITLDSTLGKGTTFAVYLPISGKRQADRPYKTDESPMGTERILFVDDEAAIAGMGSQVLERLGYFVTMRTSSLEALELFRSKPEEFDLVITDMTMPNMTGDQLAMELMDIQPNIPVILCTGYSKKISDKSASEIGIKAIAYKPIVKAELAKTVRKVLDEVKMSD